MPRSTAPTLSPASAFFASFCPTTCFAQSRAASTSVSESDRGSSVAGDRSSHTVKLLPASDTTYRLASQPRAISTSSRAFVSDQAGGVLMRQHRLSRTNATPVDSGHLSGRCDTSINKLNSIPQQGVRALAASHNTSTAFGQPPCLIFRHQRVNYLVKRFTNNHPVQFIR